MAQLELAPSVRDLRGQAIEAIVNRLAQIDLSPLLVYRIDSVPESALASLAWQFDIAAVLWQLLSPGADPRAMLKSAIPLHASRGTPGAVKAALAALGWSGATLLEGQKSWGGAAYPASQGWAVCRIVIALQPLAPAAAAVWQPGVAYPARAIVSYNGKYFYAAGGAAASLAPQIASADQVSDWDEITDVDLLTVAPWYPLPPGLGLDVPAPADLAAIAAAFNFFKNARSWLDSIVLVWPGQSDALSLSEFTGDFDTLHLSEIQMLGFAPQSDTLAAAPDYSRRWQHAGINYSKTAVGIVEGAFTVNGAPTEGPK